MRRVKDYGIDLPEGEWIRIGEAAGRLRDMNIGITEWALRGWIKAGRVRAIRIMHRWYVCWEDVVGCIKTNWGPEAPTK